MQVVDFFDAKWVSHTTNDKLFFIFDNNDGKPVSVSSDNAIQPHSVNVRNENNKLCWILPIDHNLNIKKVGSNDLESTCDYLLTVNGKEQLMFGEVKTGKRGWETEGISQLMTTIAIFKANHNVDDWSLKKAYVSNYRKWNVRPSTMTKQEQFRKEIGIRLYIKNEVDVEKD